MKEVKMGETCKTHWRIKNLYKIVVGKPVMKRPLGGTRHR
jgi:hypothetical protein